MNRKTLGAWLLALATVTLNACVGALMFDAGGARGGSSRQFPWVRWAELSDAESARGCWFTNWAGSEPEQRELWVVLGSGGRPTGVNAGGLVELRCPNPFSPYGADFYRACVYGTPPAPVPNPVKGGIYNKDGLLVGCKR